MSITKRVKDVLKKESKKFNSSEFKKIDIFVSKFGPSSSGYKISPIDTIGRKESTKASVHL